MKNLLILVVVLLFAPGCSTMKQLPLFSNGDSLPEDDRVIVGAKPGADGKGGSGVSIPRFW